MFTMKCCAVRRHGGTNIRVRQFIFYLGPYQRNLSIAPFLPPRAGFSPVRNQARQKLSSFSASDFQNFVQEVYIELYQRYPPLREDCQTAHAIIVKTRHFHPSANLHLFVFIQGGYRKIKRYSRGCVAIQTLAWRSYPESEATSRFFSVCLYIFSSSTCAFMPILTAIIDFRYAWLTSRALAKLFCFNATPLPMLRLISNMLWPEGNRADWKSSYNIWWICGYL